jgi:hypothetical protein
MRLEREKLELERQRLDLERSRTAAPKADAKAIEQARAEVDRALRTLAVRYSDFAEYDAEMSRLADLVRPGTASAEQYLECIYLLAKHASFSTIAQSKRASKGEQMRNEDVVALLQAGVGDEVIIGTIRRSAGAYRLSVADLIELRRNRVSDPVLKAMLDSAH